MELGYSIMILVKISIYIYHHHYPHLDFVALKWWLLCCAWRISFIPCPSPSLFCITGGGQTAFSGLWSIFHGLTPCILNPFFARLSKCILSAEIPGLSPSPFFLRPYLLAYSRPLSFLSSFACWYLALMIQLRYYPGLQELSFPLLPWADIPSLPYISRAFGEPCSRCNPTTKALICTFVPSFN